jgi:Uma2 family endonuclease
MGRAPSLPTDRGAWAGLASAPRGTHFHWRHARRSRGIFASMRAKPRSGDRGPFRAEHLRSGDSYELSNGHAILCLPTGGSGSGPNRLGASVVGWDPAVEEAGIDTGYSPEPGMLRAPDVAVGNVPNKPGWVAGAPDLGIEYADVGQDEEKLQQKIADLLEAGTRYLWVVRLAGLRRVEVYERGKKMRTVLPGQALTAPGVLKNAVPVEALYDRDEAERATLKNLLQRRGYDDLDAVLAEGRSEGRAEGRTEGRTEGLAASVIAVLEARQIRVTKAARERIERCTDATQLDRWVRRAVVVEKVAELFQEP